MFYKTLFKYEKMFSKIILLTNIKNARQAEKKIREVTLLKIALSETLVLLDDICKLVLSNARKVGILILPTNNL